MAYRPVKNIYLAPVVHMGDIKLRQALPIAELDQLSPFLLLHHFDQQVAPGENKFNVPPHPHRGFCPITFMFEGSVEHEDSLGNKKIIGDYEVQWINAGRGLIHSEKASKEFVEKGGRYQGIQLWVNLPKSLKMNPPSYQPITGNQMKLIEGDGYTFRLVSGTYENQKGPADSDVITAMLTMKADGVYEGVFPTENHTAIYILSGYVEVNEKEKVGANHLVVFDGLDGDIQLRAEEASQILVLSGAAINEPVVSHGPFVMTSETEILEAMRDYQLGKMGYLSY